MRECRKKHSSATKNDRRQKLRTMEETTGVKVLERALNILDLLRDEAGPLGVNEIAKRCGISPATTFRLLKTLLNRGWVYQNQEEKYLLGYKITAVTEKKSFLLMLKEVSYYIMAKLSEAEQEAMNLVVRDMDRCYILGQSRTEKIVDYVPPIGTVLPFHASACGKILLSELEENILSGLLDTIDFRRMTDKTITDRAAFLEELTKIRSQGYSLDTHESQNEGFCIAVPIRSEEGEIIAALSFSGFIGYKSEIEVDYYVHLLKEASAEITQKLFPNSEILRQTCVTAE